MPPRKLGLKRPYPTQIDLSVEEAEFVARKSYALKWSKTYFMNTAIFGTAHPNWKEELNDLREMQKDNRAVWGSRKRR